MNLARGIGAALSSYGTDRSNQKREEALKAEAEQQRLAYENQLAAGGSALRNIYAAEPGQAQDADFRAASVAGMNPLSALREPGQPETFGGFTKGLNSEGNLAFFRVGDQNSIEEVQGMTPELPASRAEPVARWDVRTGEEGKQWRVNPDTGEVTPLTLPGGGQMGTYRSGAASTDPGRPKDIESAFKMIMEGNTRVDEDGYKVPKYSWEEGMSRAEMWMAGKWSPRASSLVPQPGTGLQGMPPTSYRPVTQFPNLPAGSVVGGSGAGGGAASMVPAPMAVDTIQPMEIDSLRARGWTDEMLKSAGLGR